MSDTEIELQPETLPATAPAPRPRAPETAAAPAPPRRAPRPRAIGFPWEVSPLAQFPMAELLAEIDRRHARARTLLAERKRILAKLAALEAEMGFIAATDHPATPATQPAPDGRPRRQRAKNNVSLADALAMAVEPRAIISPAEAAQLVLSNGYQSTAKHFGMVVANALSKDARFRRVGRGRYERIESS